MIWAEVKYAGMNCWQFRSRLYQVLDGMVKCMSSYAAAPHFIGNGRQICMLHSAAGSIFIANKQIK